MKIKKVNEISFNKSNKTKPECYKDAFGLLLNKDVPDSILERYLNDIDGEGAYELQRFIVNNMKHELVDWSTGIGILEAVDKMYECALENGNVKDIERNTPKFIIRKNELGAEN